jgi:alkylation response protein AidB-like acyl-CoA dehydrogenase
MDFTVPSEVAELAELTRSVLEREVTPEMLAKAEGFDPGLWAWLSSAGVLSASLPASAGGEGLGLLGHCAVLIEIGRTVAPAPYLWSIAVAAAGADRFGTPAQRRLWAAPGGRGEVVLTAALGQDDHVSASRVNSHWVLSGTLTSVDAAARADVILVPAPGGVFAVSAEDEGVFIAPQQRTDGGGAAQVTLGGVRVGEDRVFPATAADWMRDHATIGVCAQQVGVLERALEITASYATSREQFGKPIGSFQAVSQRLADAWINVEAARLTMWQAAWRLDAGLPADAELAIAKFWAAEAGHHVAHAAVHIHGGVGIDVTYPVHRYFTTAKRLEFAMGGATAQLLRLSSTW